jgi:heterodisulfide reductase subunit C2
MEKETASGASGSDHHDHAHGSSFKDEVRELIGLNPASCYQCGKCSAGCPMASEMTLMPHEMIRLVQLSRKDRLMADESMWLCLTCETCTSRCPNGFDPARMIDGLREMAMKEHAENGPRKIEAWHGAFLDQVKSRGRLFEFGAIFWYKLRSGALFDDVFAAPGMMSRGKLKFFPHTIEGADDVRRIFEACEAEEER